MERDVFIQPVLTEVDLDRRLRRGDALVVEPRDSVRDGELFVAEDADGVYVGRYALAGSTCVMHPLAGPGAPAPRRRESLQVRGVVIGVRSTL